MRPTYTHTKARLDLVHLPHGFQVRWRVALLPPWPPAVCRSITHRQNTSQSINQACVRTRAGLLQIKNDQGLGDDASWP